MPMRIVLDMDDDIVALVTRKHTESRMLPSLWKAVSVSYSLVELVAAHGPK